MEMGFVSAVIYSYFEVFVVLAYRKIVAVKPIIFVILGTVATESWNVPDQQLSIGFDSVIVLGVFARVKGQSLARL